MTKHTDATQPASLELQLTQLSQLAEEINQTLYESRSTISNDTVHKITTIATELSRISKLIAAETDEKNNLRALANMGQVINSSLNTDQVLRIVMDTIIRLIGAERGFLMLRDTSSGELTIRIARNWEQESLDDPSEFEVSRTIVNRVANEGHPVLTTNAQEDPRFGGQESIIAYNLRSILCVPLKVKDELTGVIYADNRVRTGLFTESERDLLNDFANQAAVAIENARLFESVRRTLAEVTELKNLMDNIFASIASGVITADIEDKVLLMNAAAENILGLTEAELVGRSIIETIAPLATSISSHILTVRQTDQPIIGLEAAPTLPQRGGQVDLRFNLSPLKDADQNTQGVAIVLDDLTEQKRLEAQRRLFEKMVSPQVIEQLDPDQIALGGKRGEITTLFADIRGFTTYSESLPPEELVSVLNQYLKSSADAVLAQEGTIDKFMGDAVMAWFNAPIPQPDHTLRAVKAALGIKAGIEALHQVLPQDAHLSFGVGIHYGEAVLGVVGTENRIDYTAIGDSVNTAKRIQENSAARQILLSEAAYQNVKDEVEVTQVGPIQVKGKSEPVNCYEVLGLKEQKRGLFG
ncbi:MAG TPA: adenylate/guanylate cyclase domain-containing protein [Anaerolineales bacterium]|nr:adenylate/guanylate cyclase domain-containing protein [Anaerolineales bacterium]